MADIETNTTINTTTTTTNTSHLARPSCRQNWCRTGIAAGEEDVEAAEKVEAAGYVEAAEEVEAANDVEAAEDVEAAAAAGVVQEVAGQLGIAAVNVAAALFHEYCLTH